MRGVVVRVFVYAMTTTALTDHGFEARLRLTISYILGGPVIL